MPESALAADDVRREVRETLAIRALTLPYFLLPDNANQARHSADLVVKILRYGFFLRNVDWVEEAVLKACTSRNKLTNDDVFLEATEVIHLA